MIFFISGSDHYRCQKKLKELIEQFIKKRDQSGLNVIKLDGNGLELDRFRQETLTAPFLGEKKMIVVKNIAKNKNSQAILNFLKERQAALENIVVFFELINPEDKTKLDGPLFSYLKKQKYFWRFNLLNNQALENWLKKYLAAKKIKIDLAAIHELSLMVGNDLNQLVLEIDKLTAYKNGEIISKKDVRNLVRAKFDENIFNLVDALGHKNQKLALKLTTDQLRAGAHPLLILSMIARQFKILLKIKEKIGEAKNYSVNSSQLASNLGLHPFAVKKAIAQTKNFTQEKLIKIYSELIGLESQLKSGAKNPELLFNLLVVKNC